METWWSTTTYKNKRMFLAKKSKSSTPKTWHPTSCRWSSKSKYFKEWLWKMAFKMWASGQNARNNWRLEKFATLARKWDIPYLRSCMYIYIYIGTQKYKDFGPSNLAISQSWAKQLYRSLLDHWQLVPLKWSFPLDMLPTTLLCDLFFWICICIDVTAVQVLKKLVHQTSRPWNASCSY